MAFVVESGAGDATANAYVSEAFADTHHTDRGNTQWTALTSPQKQSAIIRASDYIDKRFGRSFRGERKTKDQGLEWPRLGAFDDDGFLLDGVDDIPRGLEKACAEYALRAFIYNVLAPDPTLPVPQQDLQTGAAARSNNIVTGEVTRARVKVGPIEDETWYEPASKIAAENLGAGARATQSSTLNDFHIPEYPEADLWIEPLIENSMTMRIARA